MATPLLHQIVVHAVLEPLLELVASRGSARGLVHWGEVEAARRHVLVLRALALLLLLHVEELKHHLLHEVFEELLILATTLRLTPPILISIIVLFGIKPIWKPTELANPWTAYPLYSFLLLFSNLVGLWIRDLLSPDHKLFILDSIFLKFWLGI